MSRDDDDDDDDVDTWDDDIQDDEDNFKICDEAHNTMSVYRVLVMTK